MKTLLIILILAIGPAAQSTAKDVEVVSTAGTIDSREHPDFQDQQRQLLANEWKLAASTDATPRSYWFYKDYGSRGDDVEVWLKMIPAARDRKIGTGRNRRSFSYALQFHVFHCRDKRYSIESTVIYDAKHSVIPFPSFLSRTYREPVIPDSVSEGLWRYFCG